MRVSRSRTVVHVPELPVATGTGPNDVLPFGDGSSLPGLACLAPPLLIAAGYGSVWQVERVP